MIWTFCECPGGVGRSDAPYSAGNLERLPIKLNRFSPPMSSPPDLIRGSMSAIGFAGNMDYRIKSGNDDREAIPVSALIPFERKML